MLEDLDRVRRLTAPMDQFGRYELAESVLQRRTLDRRDRFQKAARELPPDAAAICAVSRTGARRSRRAIRESCKVEGIASGVNAARRM